MESIHAQFVAAVAARIVVRIGYYQPSDNQFVERQCVALDYGPDPRGSSNFRRYWVLEYNNETPGYILGLQAKRILSICLSDRNRHLPDPCMNYRLWRIARGWKPRLALPEFTVSS